MPVTDALFGRALATSEERAEQVGPSAGIGIFGLDAISSAAYGPEAALTLLIPLGLLGVHYIVPVIAAILILLAILYFSYRQTIDAYPQGGGSYTVASENLGDGVGLLAAPALMIDYVLTAAVGISAGVGALISAAPSLQPHTLALCLGILAGIAYLCSAYGIGATAPDSPGYQSVLSQLTGAVMGKGLFYYITIAGILLVLALSANTAFADFPRLTRAIALRDYLPHVFTVRGRRLLYSHGIYALVGLTAALLIVFRGVTDRLIPLYAIGAFLAFTLSQAGMVMHWLKMDKHRGRLWHAFVNGVGVVATGIRPIGVLLAKFKPGAGGTARLVPALIGVM